MQLMLIILACFLLLFIVEVFLGGALPGREDGSPGLRGRLPAREFFGYALPIAAAGLGIPMSFQHPWALLLVAGAVVLHLRYGRNKRCA